VSGTACGVTAWSSACSSGRALHQLVLRACNFSISTVASASARGCLRSSLLCTAVAQVDQISPRRRVVRPNRALTRDFDRPLVCEHGARHLRSRRVKTVRDGCFSLIAAPSLIHSYPRPDKSSPSPSRARDSQPMARLKNHGLLASATNARTQSNAAAAAIRGIVSSTIIRAVPTFPTPPLCLMAYPTNRRVTSMTSKVSGLATSPGSSAASAQPGERDDCGT